MLSKDEVLKMARQAGYQHPDAVGQCEDFSYFDLEAFAKLVADAASAKAVEREREACAKVCDDIDKSHWGCEVKASWCSDAIRARGEA